MPTSSCPSANSSRARAITFEASAGYLYNPLAPERIKKHLPDAELFAVLRDPVQRAFSAWNMFRQFENTPFFPDYHDPRTFEQAVEDEISGKPMHVAHRYLDRGVYAPQLERYIKLFGRDRVHVFAYPEFKSAPHVVVDSICATMGLGPLPPQEGLSRIRSNERPYSHGMSSELRERLSAVVKRTLRRDVLEFIRYTKRTAQTSFPTGSSS